MKQYLLGFDVGSSSVKASLVDMESGQCAASAFYPESEAPIKAVKAAGGKTLGVVPSIVEATGRTSQYNDVVKTCNNLSERKQLMLDLSDVFIALPGGVGTLDEVFTVAASYTIGYHHKRVILYNINGFWNSTIAMLDDLQQQGMVRSLWRDYICVANNLDEIEQLII